MNTAPTTPAKTTTTTVVTSHQNAPEWSWTVLVGICLLILFVWGIKSCREKAKEEAASAPAQQYQAPTRIIKVGRERKLYKFADYQGGCISLYFQSEFATYPKGGKITIETPSGRINKDEPGTVNKWAQEPPGTYKICPDSPETWGVEIWN